MVDWLFLIRGSNGVKSPSFSLIFCPIIFIFVLKVYTVFLNIYLWLARVSFYLKIIFVGVLICLDFLIFRRSIFILSFVSSGEPKLELLV